MGAVMQDNDANGGAAGLPSVELLVVKAQHVRAPFATLENGSGSRRKLEPQLKPLEYIGKQ